jgi:hypothetical protein
MNKWKKLILIFAPVYVAMIVLGVMKLQSSPPTPAVAGEVTTEKDRNQNQPIPENSLPGDPEIAQVSTSEESNTQKPVGDSQIATPKPVATNTNRVISKQSSPPSKTAIPAPKPAAKSNPAPAPAPTPAPKPVATVNCSGGFSVQFLCLLNQYRSSKGLGQVSWSSGLASVALGHSQWMNTTGTFSHVPKPPRYVESKPIP